MKPGIPWSVKGIEPDAREAAKEAARRSGMTLGEWLNSTIMETADHKAEAPPRREKPEPRKQEPRKDQRRRQSATLEDIAEQLSKLSRRETGSAQHVAMVDDGERASTNDALSRILTRVESNERQTVEAFTAVNDRLSVLGRQMAQAVKPRGEDTQGIASLEKAVRNIVEHMEVSEKRNRENIKSLHERISAMSTKAASANNEQVLRQVPAFSQLEQRLSELAKRVDRHDFLATQPAAPDLLKQELTDLANRIDTVRETAESLANRAQTQAVQASQQELRAIEQRIVGLIREAQASLSGNGAGPAEIQRLRAETERLNARIDEAQRAQTPPGDVLALRNAVEQLSTRVAQGPDMRPLADMDKRILDITQRLEQTQAQTRSLPQFSDLERRIAELDHKLNEAVSGRGSTAANELEDRMGEIVSRVDRAEQQLASMETIERAINQIYDSMEQQKSWTQQVANEAANRMAQNILAAGPQQVSLTGAPEIQALQDGLQAVRSAAETADHRNQETLEAVHETLEQIVSKLAELETAAIGQRVAVAAAPAAQAAPQWQAVTSPNIAPAPPRDVFGIEAAPLGVPPMPSPTAQHDGFQTNTNLQAQPAETDDFIAAARRAAQASFQQKGALGGMTPPMTRTAPEAPKKGFSLFSRGKADNAIPGLPEPGKAANTNEKRRKLLLMGLVLLAAVSAFTFNIMAPKAPIEPVAPAALEQPVEKPAANPETSQAPAPAASASEVTAQPEGTTPLVPVEGKPQVQGALDPESDPLLSTGSLQPAGDPGTPVTTAVEGIAEKDMPPAETGTLKLREAAALGNPQAQFVVATRYLNGENGVKQDFAKAAMWYGKAAAKGLAPAQYRLGTLYERGKGVAKDSETALKWYERAAALGNIKAMHNAAVLAAGSDTRSPDYKRAFKWFSLGAAHGLKDSQFNLAVLLERGLGTKADPREALFWYSVAAKQNDADATKRAEAIKSQVSESDQLAAKNRLKNWTPDTAPDGANVVAVSQPEWNSQGGSGG